MIYIGIDQHKRFSQVAVIDQNGCIVDERKLYHDDTPSMVTFFERYRGAAVAVEATRNFDWLVQLLDDCGLDVRLANPLRTRLIAEARIKTDRLDAHVLAQLLRTGFLPEAYLPQQSVRDGRQLHRYRTRLVRLRGALKNRVHALLDRHNIQPPQTWTDLFGRAGRQWLGELTLRPPYDSEMQSTLRLLDTLTVEIDEISGRIRRQMATDPQAKLLMTIPGVAELTAYQILYEAGDIKRFATAKRFASFCALTPSTRQSADRVYHGRTGRQGNLYLKHALVEAAHWAKRIDPRMAGLHAKLTRKRGRGVATVAVARKLAIAVHQMLTHNQPYNMTTPNRQFVG